MIYEGKKLSFAQGCKDFFKGIINPLGRTTRKGFLCGLLMNFTVVFFVSAIINVFMPIRLGSVISIISYYCLLVRRYFDLGFRLLGMIMLYIILGLLGSGVLAILIQIVIGLLPTNIFEIKTMNFIKMRSVFFRKGAYIRKVWG